MITDIKFKCGGCMQPIEAPESMTGQVISCVHCNQNIVVPEMPVTDIKEVETIRENTNYKFIRVCIAGASGFLILMGAFLVHFTFLQSANNSAQESGSLLMFSIGYIIGGFLLFSIGSMVCDAVDALINISKNSRE